MRSSALVLAAVLGACGGVHDLELPSAPFATVRAHVDLGTVTPRAAGRPLIAAIVWGRVPSVPALCYEYASDPVVSDNCPDPFGFFPGAVDVTVPVAMGADGSITFTLDHLPSANVLVGDDVDHVAYASIFIVADTDANGAIGLQAQNQGGKGGGRPGQAGTTSTPPDEIVAASFVTLKGEQQRLSFREGSFDALKLFYPIPACATPPSGFTVIRSGAYGDAAATCEATSLETSIEVGILDANASFALACRANGNNGGGGGGNGGNGSRVNEAGASQADVGDQGQQQKPPNTKNAHCLSPHLFVIPNKSASPSTPVCPGLSTYALVGCSNDPNCDTPEWDHRDTPPDWWPCAP